MYLTFYLFLSKSPRLYNWPYIGIMAINMLSMDGLSESKIEDLNNVIEFSMKMLKFNRSEDENVIDLNDRYRDFKST